MKNGIKEWILVADKDIETIKVLMESPTFITHSIAFHCQQAIEKYFKAYLLEHGWELKRTHDLMRLYIEIEKIKDLKINTDTLMEIDKMYIDTRYPDDFREPTKEELKKFFDLAAEIELKIKHELGINAGNTES
ncbi:MAG: HEPN domain-containing protein [Endomicrobium sp.]|jgi:HEPN domain-containing protein|nr:HEPN domain-containing protein [Endomicrobium sp.]